MRKVKRLKMDLKTFSPRENVISGTLERNKGNVMFPDEKRDKTVVVRNIY